MNRVNPHKHPLMAWSFQVSVSVEFSLAHFASHRAKNPVDFRVLQPCAVVYEPKAEVTLSSGHRLPIGPAARGWILVWRACPKAWDFPTFGDPKLSYRTILLRDLLSHHA